MQMKRFFLIMVVIMGSWLVWTSSLAAQDGEEGPVNVGLLYFTATIQADGVRLDWGTATELNTAGFIIQRSSGSSSFETLNDIGIVSGTGGVATGATYSELDTTAVIGQTYSYKLVEIETNSNQIDLETVTVLFDPQPTATSILIGNPTPRPSNTPAAVATATTMPTATTTNTAVPSQNTGQATATPLATAISEPTATPNNSNTLTTVAQPTRPLQIPPTADLRLDQAFDSSGVNSSGANSGVVLAQEEPTSAAYPGPDSPPLDTPIDADSYPPGQEPPVNIAPENSTPYPASSPGDTIPTRTIIGSAALYPPGTDITVPAPSVEVIRGRILLWVSFLLALFIFLSGVLGAIVLYRRRPA